MSKNPKILNLDELELAESEITIKHEGQEHKMRILTVDAFIEQQKRQADHDKLVENDPDEATMKVAVEIIKNSIADFFPTLDVGALPTPKLFAIFAWMNELTAKLNEASSEDVVAETEGEAGNDQPLEEASN